YSNHTRDKAHLILEGILKELGSQQRIVIYFDGDPAEEKAETRQRHRKMREEAQTRAHHALKVLRDRVHSNRRVRKTHFNSVQKHLRGCFKWSTAGRDAFIVFLQSKGWIVVLCETESDVKIAQDCLIDNIVVSRDSDMLIHAMVSTLWRPVGHASQGKFFEYEVHPILTALSLSISQWTSLGVVTKNDYSGNIRTLGIATNFELIKTLDGNQDVPTLVKQYLRLGRVTRKNRTGETILSAINASNTHRWYFGRPTYDALRNEFDRVCDEFDKQKQMRQVARKDFKRSHTWLPGHKAHQHYNHFRTVDRAPHDPRATVSTLPTSVAVSHMPESPPQAPVPVFPATAFASRGDSVYPSNAQVCTLNIRACPSCANLSPAGHTKKPQHRSRYSFKERRKGKEHDPPEVCTQFRRKNYKTPLDPPVITSPSTATKKAHIRPEITNSNKKTVLNALDFEHPIVSLDVGTLHTNVREACKTDASLARRTAIVAVESDWVLRGSPCKLMSMKRGRGEEDIEDDAEAGSIVKVVELAIAFDPGTDANVDLNTVDDKDADGNVVDPVDPLKGTGCCG
ncbi:hypothetical protein BGW38_004254, partial [Lunasporangiospora selenospora]